MRGCGCVGNFVQPPVYSGGYGGGYGGGMGGGYGGGGGYGQPMCCSIM